MYIEELKSRYLNLLRQYLIKDNEEEALYEAYKLSQVCFEAKINIEEIMNIHKQALENILETLPPDRMQDSVLKSFNLILEFIIRFGLVCQNYFEMLQWTDERIQNAFYQAGEALTAGLDIQKMLSVILSLVKNLTEAAGCAIILFEKENKIIKVSEGLDGEDEFFSDSLFKQVAKEGKVSFINDMKEETSPKILRNGREIRSVLALPLNFKDKTVGVLGIYFTQPHHYEEKEINLLTSFSYQAAAAIDSAHLFSELQRHDKTLETLYAINKVVNQTLDIEEILSSSLSRAMASINADSGSIHLLDEIGENLIIKTYSGLLSEEFVSVIRKLKIGEGIPGIAAQSRKAIAVDISQFPGQPLFSYITKEGLASFIGTPLMSKGKVVGALALGAKKKRTFTRDDLDLLFSIGNVIGIAVENAKLYRDVKDKAEYISALYRISQPIKASLDIDKIFDAMVSEMSNVLSFDRTGINLLRDKMVEVFALVEDIKIPELGKGTRVPMEKSSTMFILDRRAGLIRGLDGTPFYEDAILFKKGLRSVIQVPLISKSEPVGIFSIESCSPDAYTRRDLDLVRAIADQIAISIENARLYDDLKQSNLELEKKLKELEEFQTLAVGRELRMIELKERIQGLEDK